MVTDGVDDFVLVCICLQRTNFIPSPNLGLIGVQIRRSETNLYKENASTSARYLSSVELGSTEIWLKRGHFEIGVLWETAELGCGYALTLDPLPPSGRGDTLRKGGVV